MKFTFGIITDGNAPNRISEIIDSIESMEIDSYEILVVGGKDIDRRNLKFIPFDDHTTPSWISKKKNIITNNSQFENIVYLHDYIKFDKDWYINFLEFGNDFSVCINPILNTDETRYRDWCLWKDDAKNYIDPNNCLLPYGIKHLSGMMYISGAYWVAKRDFMLKNPLNEILKWGQGEDVEWSLRIRDITEFKMNTNSIVKLMKYKDRIFSETTDSENLILGNIKSYKNNDAYSDLIKTHLNKWIK